MKRETLETAGAIGISVFIASCCLGPALFLLFGVSVGALGALAALEPVRPYLIALGGALLVHAGWRIHRKPPPGDASACPADACGQEGSARRVARRLFWIATIVYLLAVAYPSVLAALCG